MKNENTCCSGSRSLSGESAASAPPAQGPARPPWPCASLYSTIGKGLNLPFSSYGIFHRPYLQGDHVQQGLVRLVPKDEQIEWIHNILMWKIHRHICIKFMQIPSTCKIKSRLKYRIMACVITYRELIYKSDLLWMKVSRKVVSTEVTFDDRRTSETWGIEGCNFWYSQGLIIRCRF